MPRFDVADVSALLIRAAWSAACPRCLALMLHMASSWWVGMQGLCLGRQATAPVCAHAFSASSLHCPFGPWAHRKSYLLPCNYASLPVQVLVPENAGDLKVVAWVFEQSTNILSGKHFNLTCAMHFQLNRCVSQGDGGARPGIGMLVQPVLPCC